MFSKTEALRYGIQLAAGLGVSKVTKDIITNNTTVETTTDKVEVAVGSAVLGMMVADAASEYVTRRLDSIFGSKDNTEETETPEA